MPRTGDVLVTQCAAGVGGTEVIDVEFASDCASDVDSGCDDGHLS